MTIEASIYSTLTSLVSGRVYPDIAPENVTKPYITYQQVGGQSVNFTDPTVPSLKNGRWQINCWATTRTAAAALSRSVEDTIRAASALRPTVISAPVAGHEPETGLYGTRQDFSFWF